MFQMRASQRTQEVAFQKVLLVIYDIKSSLNNEDRTEVTQNTPTSHANEVDTTPIHPTQKALSWSRQELRAPQVLNTMKKPAPAGTPE